MSQSSSKLKRSYSLKSCREPDPNTPGPNGSSSGGSAKKNEAKVQRRAELLGRSLKVISCEDIFSSASAKCCLEQKSKIFRI